MARIAVVGDAFVDHYIIGKVRGMSAEAPIPIIDVISQTNLPGGAGNVTVNIAALGGDVFYVEKVEQNYPRKNRLVTQEGQQLARWDEDDYCSPYSKIDLIPLMDADAVIVSDYGKGSIGEEVIQLLRDVATAMPVFVDTKGDPSPWIGADVTMFPNMEEYKRYESKYEWFPQVVLKRGGEGLAFLQFGSVVYQLPASPVEVKSVNGAGDTVIASFALAALEGLTLPECMAFANTCAGKVVSQSFLKRTTTKDAVLDVMFPSNPLEVRSYELSQRTTQSEVHPLVSRFGLYITIGEAGMGGSQDDRYLSVTSEPTPQDGIGDTRLLAEPQFPVDDDWAV
jgi:bifunctional ADP-heptose synthase (sugar kinase/adenylyltransferase)